MAAAAVRPSLNALQHSSNAVPTKSYTAPAVDDKGTLIVRRPGQNPPGFSPPQLEWLNGTWYFTHSTLPIWKDKRNVRITYTVTPHTTSEPRDRLDDVIEYNTMGSNKLQTVLGREYSDKNTGAWDWRGKGIIKIASSHWEILSWGGSGGDEYLVTWFEKTFFTPAAIDIYHRRPDGITQALYNEIIERITALRDPNLDKLVAEIYEVKHDIMA